MPSWWEWVVISPSAWDRGEKLELHIQAVYVSGEVAVFRHGASMLSFPPSNQFESCGLINWVILLLGLCYKILGPSPFIECHSHVAQFGSAYLFIKRYSSLFSYSFCLFGLLLTHWKEKNNMLLAHMELASGICLVKLKFMFGDG
jgi:hypothetical protein